MPMDHHLDLYWSLITQEVLAKPKSSKNYKIQRSQISKSKNSGLISSQKMYIQYLLWYKISTNYNSLHYCNKLEDNQAQNSDSIVKSHNKNKKLEENHIKLPGTTCQHESPAGNPPIIRCEHQIRHEIFMKNFWNKMKQSSCKQQRVSSNSHIEKLRKREREGRGKRDNGKLTRLRDCNQIWPTRSFGSNGHNCTHPAHPPDKLVLLHEWPHTHTYT